MQTISDCDVAQIIDKIDYNFEDKEKLLDKPTYYKKNLKNIGYDDQILNSLRKLGNDNLI